MSLPTAAQQLMWDAIMSGADAANPAVEVHFRGDATLDAAGRLAIYARMYRGRLLDAIQSDFPWTAQLIGDDAPFARLVQKYFDAYPMRSFTLAAAGENFADFIERCGCRADASEVAKLERIRGVVSIAIDTESLPLQALSQHGPEVVNMRCVFVPGMQHFVVRYDVCAVVDALTDHTPVPAPVCRPGLVVAWRKDEHVYHTCLSGAAAQALKLATAGRSIAEVCDAFAQSTDPAGEAFATLGAWFADGWVCALEQVC